MNKRALGRICSHGTTECKDINGIITPVSDYIIFCCVRFIEIVGRVWNQFVWDGLVQFNQQQLIFLREEVSI